MKITDILKPELVVMDVEASSKKQLLEKISEVATPATGLETQIIFDALIERERLGTTGIGKGVAIPHARLAGLKDLFCAFFKVPAVDFEAIDGEKVDLVFCLLVPEESGADHLKALARISKILRNEDVCVALRNAQTSAQALAVIASTDDED